MTAVVAGDALRIKSPIVGGLSRSQVPTALCLKWQSRDRTHFALTRRLELSPIRDARSPPPLPPPSLSTGSASRPALCVHTLALQACAAACMWTPT
ncbi:hypothetical protein GGX14DRAFT_554021 [Mycena pura]|uniref:Uncharacterized protein n=1 Tax=Mycena pura TaxID=153505 RepID=A0AAD7E6W2_9AGAR|nr:hypothetical protein GGX14DRAFT_554021 [Mycena pura]